MISAMDSDRGERYCRNCACVRAFCALLRASTLDRCYEDIQHKFPITQIAFIVSRVDQQQQQMDKTVDSVEDVNEDVEDSELYPARAIRSSDVTYVPAQQCWLVSIGV